MPLVYIKYGIHKREARLNHIKYDIYQIRYKAQVKTQSALRPCKAPEYSESKELTTTHHL
jgi:hypothetical protein